ncbi:unnamed protein product [Protopolystoma xenopodis]|uniref:Uncharacterized protein n=1 Tax=Protopolystoma xenopodis TaxID=117903 RepID=A0A3S5BVL2_9PLAT|nr:unnamed protein product [Protopolystoma xenopodis]
MIGEPVRWESYLQLIVDLLITKGQPDHSPANFPDPHLPILACNLDLIFMAEAPMPRFGHGAFLVCLESLYEKITGNPLTYTAILGKPSEITYRYAEHVLSKVARRMGYDRPLQKIYFFG